jgi:hypothetical protein
MSDFNYIEYLKNNPLFKGKKTQSTKLITEAQMTPKSAKMKMSELKAKIREEILSTLSENEGIDADELSMQDVFDMLDNEEFEDMEDMPIDEAKKDEASTDEVPAEEEMDAEVNVDVKASPPQGLSAEEQEIQNSLKIAYDSASAIGDQKLADQIGNSITFFTRTHVVER